MRRLLAFLRPRTLLVTLALVMLTFAGFGMANAQSIDRRCFPETGECISGRIRSFWEQNGGLPVFGLPITPERPEATLDGTFTSQWFERTRLELHPQNAAPYDVLLARAGDIRLHGQGRDWFSFRVIVGRPTASATRTIVWQPLGEGATVELTTSSIGKLAWAAQ